MKTLARILATVATASATVGCSHSLYQEKDINLVSARSVEKIPLKGEAYDANQVRTAVTDYNTAKKIASNFPEAEFSLIYADPLEPEKVVELQIDTRGSPNRSIDELVTLRESLPNQFNARFLRVGSPDRGMLSPRSQGNQLSSNTGLKGVGAYNNEPFRINARKTTGIVNGNRTDCYHFNIDFSPKEKQLVQELKVTDPLLVVDIAVNGAAVYGISGQWISGAASPAGTVIDALVAEVEGAGSNAPNGTWQRTVDLSANLDQTLAGLRWSAINANMTGANKLILSPRGFVYATGAHNFRIHPTSLEFDVINEDGNYLAGLAYGIARGAPASIGTRLAVHAKDCPENEQSQGQNNSTNNNHNNNGGNGGGKGPGTPESGVTGGSSSSSGGSPSQSVTGGSSSSSGGTGNPQ